MGDYIHKEDAIDALDRIFDNVPMELTTEILRLRRELRGLPPADVAPVVHGRWVNGSCNKCGKHAPYYLMSSTYYDGDFCPNCGAKMDRSEQNGRSKS